MAQAPKKPKIKAAQPPRGGAYSANVVRYVRTLWCSGEFPSDKALADFVGMVTPRGWQTISEWRRDRKPDGNSWEELREKVARSALQQAERELTKSAAERMKRQVQVVDSLYNFGVLPILSDLEELEVVDAKGQKHKLRVLKNCPSGSEAAGFVEKWLKLERLIHGQPTDRVASQQENAALLMDALQLAGLGDEQVAAVAEALEKLSGAGEESDPAAGAGAGWPSEPRIG
jgi:hypothetical protein